MTKPRKRLLYVNSVGNHDVRFFSRAPKISDRWDILFVTFNPTIAESVARTGANVKCLVESNRPYDDWHRASGAYGWLDRYKLKKCFSYYRQSYRQVLQDFRPHLVHSGWLQTDSYLAALEKNSPLIVMALGSDALVRPFDNAANSQKTRFTLSKADLIYGDSVAVKMAIEKLTAKLSAPLLIRPKGIDLTRFHGRARRPRQGKLRLLMVKNHVPVSRFDTVFAALVDLKPLRDQLQIDIYGGGRELDVNKAKLDKLGLKEFVTIHGPIENDLLPEIYRCSDVILSCNESEGTSFAMMEAMASGMVPVVTHLPAYSEFIRHNENGFLFDIGDSRALAQILRGLISHDEAYLAKMRGLNMELAAAQFDADKSFAELVGWYDKLTAAQNSKNSL